MQDEQSSGTTDPLLPVLCGPDRNRSGLIPGSVSASKDSSFP